MSKNPYLGKKYTDSISGFTGVATAVCEYIHSCVQISLSAKSKDGGPEKHWFDAPQLIDDETGERLVVDLPGGPGDHAPSRHPV